MADVMSERMEQVSRAATERLLATQRDLAAARADIARYKAALEKIADTVTMADTLLVRGIARAALEAQ